MRRFNEPFSILSAKGATGVGTAFGVQPFKHLIVAVSAPANTSLTFKFQGSIGISATSDGSPDFSAAQAAANHWDYVAAYDLQSPGTVITGDTGVTLNNATEADNTRIYMINVDALAWFNMEVTAWTDGDVSAYIVGYSD